MSKKIDYKLVKLNFFTDFSKILDNNLNKLLKSYFYSRLIVYNKATNSNLLNKSLFLFNMKLQTVLMNQITVYFLIKKYYNLIFTSLLHDSDKFHLPKGSNLSNILEMLHSSVHMQKGGESKEYIIKFILLISLFFSFYAPVSASGLVSHPGLKTDLLNAELPGSFMIERRTQEEKRAKKQQQYNEYYGRAGFVASAILGTLLLPGITGLSDQEMKEKIINTVVELNKETNDIYHLVSSSCVDLVTTLHSKGLLDTSSLKEIVPETFEKEKEITTIEKQVEETINAAVTATNSVLDLFWSTKPPIVGKREDIPTRKIDDDEFVKEIMDEVEEEEEANDDGTVNIDTSGTALTFKQNTTEAASKLERFMRQSLDKTKDPMLTEYNFYCNSAFKSKIVWGEINGMMLVRQLNGHIQLVNKDLSMIDQLKSFLLTIQSHAENKIKESILYSPDPIYKEIIQKIDIFKLIMTYSIVDYFPFDNMQTFDQSVASIRNINKKVGDEAQWLQFQYSMDKRNAQKKFLEEEEKQRFDVQMQINTAELRSELEGIVANQVIKDNLEKAQRIIDTTNSTQQYNKAKQIEWAEFFDSNFGKDNPLSQFVSTTINGGIIEGVFSPLLNNIKKYGYEILYFILAAGGVLVITYNLGSICFFINRSLKVKAKPESVPAPPTNPSENVNTVVLAKLPVENQLLEIKYDQNGRPREFDLILIKSHMTAKIKDKLFNLLAYYKQHNDKLILFYFNDEILCGSFITIQANKILIETIDSRTIQISYDDIIDPITTPYLTTSYIRNKYIECKTLFENKMRSNPLSPEELFAKQLQLLSQTRMSQKSHHKTHKHKLRRSSSSSSSSSSGSGSRRSKKSRSRKSRSRRSRSSSRENDPLFVTV